MTNPKKFIESVITSQSLLGLDFGDKTIGIAVSDKSFTIATPIATIRRKGIIKDLAKLFEIIDEFNVGGIVFGLPLSLNGQENQRTEKVRYFIKELQLKSKVLVDLYDERFSSDVIFKALRKESVPSSKIKKKLDQQSAAYILQGYLDNAKNII